ncbi:hypothetical protein GGX14DRAFT_417016 [Mycena pura]|uniref:Transmembrane protein 135 N-terminal domain-containing protein n=1 Tax=Mycena pura TaxID=153505 RepID=A0AAD7E5U9_9AGAR|nr:hypothetical protein GGX14DRAFT_417016 [Mycena pura]
MDDIEHPSPPRGSKSATSTPSRPMLTSSDEILSFENLVALANYQERIKHARKILWRDKGQPVVDLPTLWDCLEHAVAGGTRSAALAFNIRACFNLFLVLTRMRKVPRAQWFTLTRDAIFGTDSFRFAAMLGSFAALYKFLINALPIVFPSSLPSTRGLSSPIDAEDETTSSPDSGLVTPGLQRRAPRLSLSTHAQMVLVRKRTRRWHSAFAGAISGGLAIMWEKRSRRTDIAQQVFVRGLQGTYNTYSERWGFSIPYGAVVVFSLACGQIMYAFFMRPDTLPRSYVNWIQEASKASADSFIFNRKAVQEHSYDMEALDRIIARPDVTPANTSSLSLLRERVLAGAPDLPRYVPCCGLHPMANSCVGVAITRFLQVSRWMLPIYSALHFVPSILLRWRIFRSNPAHVLMRAGVGSLRSSAFLGMFVIICQAVLCIKHNIYETLMAAPSTSPIRRLLPQRLIDVLISRYTWWLSGFATGLALFLEDERRRAELAMYVIPKALESLWVVARGRGLVLRTGNWGESVLAAIGMGMIMTIYQNDPHHLSGLVRRILYQFIGPN